MDFNSCSVVFVDEYSLDPNVGSNRTVDFHCENIKYFKKFLEEYRPQLITDFTLIKQEDVEAYLRHMGHKELAKTTIEGRIKSVRVFSRVLYKAGIVAEDFAERIKYRVKSPPQIIPFSEDQVLLMLKNLDMKKPTGKRMAAVIKLFCDTGIRLFELHNLKVGDIDFKSRGVYVRIGKNKKQRYIPIGIDCIKSLLKYMDAFRINSSDLNAPLFQTIYGNRWAKRSIQEALSTLGKKAKLEDVRCSPHTFRHFFSLSALKNGVPSSALQKCLGHTTMDMVNRYLNISDALLQQLYISCNDLLIKRGDNDPPSPVGV